MLLAMLFFSACGPTSDRPPPPPSGEPMPPPREAPNPAEAAQATSPDPADCPSAVGAVTIQPDHLSYARPIGFDLYAPALAPDAAPTLAEVGRAIAACPSLEIEVQVHTDTRRVTSFNARQSQAIAEQIVAALVEAGAPREHLVACGRGEAGPHLGGAEPWHESQNRVVFARLDHPAATHSCPAVE
jgi:outer membrane protein OmpA-like peptidoglycan-associated protein